MPREQGNSAGGVLHKVNKLTQPDTRCYIGFERLF
jgi:hypothetical protein